MSQTAGSSCITILQQMEVAPRTLIRFCKIWMQNKAGLVQCLKNYIPLPTSPLIHKCLKSTAQVHFFHILGDNFYDQVGQLTSEFWSEISPAARGKFVGVVNGNHDHWVRGAAAEKSRRYLYFDWRCEVRSRQYRRGIEKLRARFCKRAPIYTLYDFWSN